MYCGSCIHDNTLAAALGRLGHEVALLPTYTPMRTDEPSVSGPRVFYGALNVYLQQKSAFFRHTPRALDWLLDRPRLLAWISKRFAGTTDARELGELTLAVLQGEEGPQQKELEKLVGWLASEFRPDVVQITNSLFLGLVRRFRQELGVPVVVAVQGEDLFFEDLPEPFRAQVLDEMKRRAAEVDAFIAPSRFYAEKMSAVLGVESERMRVVPLGVKGDADEAPVEARADSAPTIGFLARISPEKGLHLLAEAFRELAQRPEGANARLKIAGWLGTKDEAYFAEVMSRFDAWGLADRVEHAGELDLEGKRRFLDSLDVLSVPTVYREPKGLFVLEALARGVPVVQPRHGSFPEMIEATGGGVLCEPDSPADLARVLGGLLANDDERRRLGVRGREAVRRRFDEGTMARNTLAVYENLLREDARHEGAGATEDGTTGAGSGEKTPGTGPGATEDGMSGAGSGEKTPGTGPGATEDETVGMGAGEERRDAGSGVTGESAADEGAAIS